MSEMIRTSLSKAAQAAGPDGDFEVEITVSQESFEAGQPVINIDVYQKGPNLPVLAGQLFLVLAAPITAVIAYYQGALAGCVCALGMLLIGVELRRRSRHLFRKSRSYRSVFVGNTAVEELGSQSPA